MSALSSGRARSRRTGWPIRATFRIDMKQDYMVFNEAIRFCARCGGALESRTLKTTEPARLVCVRCNLVHYIDPKVAGGTVISDDHGRIVLVKPAIEPGYGKGVFSVGFLGHGA